MTTVVRVLVTVALVTLGVATTIEAQPPGAGRGDQGGRGGSAPDPAVVARGRQIYTTNCVTCHGPDARGGSDAGADLIASTIAFANDNGVQLAAFLKVGRPERRMPPFALADADVIDLWTFLRSIAPGGRGGGRGTIHAIVVGDATAGEAYFNGAGRCTECHSVTGNLKGIGARLPVAAIQGRIVMPRGSGGYPRGFNSPPDPNETAKKVTITQPSGQVITGSLMWITDFNVTLTDPSGIRRTVARNGDVPKVEITDPLEYHIEHMKKLTDKDMHDLTAYLVTLK